MRMSIIHEYYSPPHALHYFLQTSIKNACLLVLCHLVCPTFLDETFKSPNKTNKKLAKQFASNSIFHPKQNKNASELD